METVIQFKGTIYEKGYGLIAQKVMRDKDLDPKAKAIYAYICSFAGVGQNGERTAFPGVKIMMKELGIKSEDTYYKHRKQLIKKGYISIEKQRKDGSKFDNNLYIINAIPIVYEQDKNINTTLKLTQAPLKKQNRKNKPYPNFPSTENSSSENSSSENQGINNNSNTINRYNNIRYNQNLNLSEEIYNLKLPIALKKFLLNEVTVSDNGEPDIFEIENFYNTSNLISLQAFYNDVNHINEFEFINIVKSIYLKADRPIYKTRGILQDWCLKYLSFKRDNISSETKDFQKVDFLNNDLIKRILK